MTSRSVPMSGALSWRYPAGWRTSARRVVGVLVVALVLRLELTWRVRPSPAVAVPEGLAGWGRLHAGLLVLDGLARDPGVHRSRVRVAAIAVDVALGLVVWNVA